MYQIHRHKNIQIFMLTILKSHSCICMICIFPSQSVLINNIALHLHLGFFFQSDLFLGRRPKIMSIARVGCFHCSTTKTTSKCKSEPTDKEWKNALSSVFPIDTLYHNVQKDRFCSRYQY